MSPTYQFGLQPFIHRGVSLSSSSILSTVWTCRTTLTILDAFHYSGTPDRYDDSMTLVNLSQSPSMLLGLLVLVVPPGILPIRLEAIGLELRQSPPWLSVLGLRLEKHHTKDHLLNRRHRTIRDWSEERGGWIHG